MYIFGIDWGDLFMALINLREIVGKIAYPVGSVISTVENKYPGDYWGGEWISLATDTFLHGSSSAFPVDEGSNIIDGGSVNQLNISHTHPAHSHDHKPNPVSGYEDHVGVCTYLINNTTVGRRGWLTQSVDTSRYAFTLPDSAYLAANKTTASQTGNLESSGSSGSRANLPPYKYVYIWIRIGW